MAIVANQTDSIGDILYIKTDIAAIGLSALLGFFDSTSGEDSDTFFERKFQYSLDGITWSEWLDLNTLNIQQVPVSPTDTLFLRYRYKQIGEGNLSFSSNTVTGTYLQLDCPFYFKNSIFYKYFNCSDIEVIGWYLNVTEKLYSSDLAKYIDWESENGTIDDSVALWHSITKFFAFYVILSRKYQTFYQNEELISSYLTQRGLFISEKESLEDMNNIMKNYNYEISRRGTIKIKNFKSETNLYNGELIRLLNIDNSNEFIFDFFFNELCGWHIDSSSPMYRGLENHINANKLDLDLISITSGVSRIDSDYKTMFTINNESSTLREGINDSNDVSKFIPISTSLDYLLEFDIEVLSENVELSIGVNSYNSFNTQINATKSMFDDSNRNYWIENQNLNVFYNQQGFHRIKCILYNSQKPSNFTQDKLNINVGNNLKFSNDLTNYIVPFILINEGSVKIKNLSFKRLSTEYSRGFIQMNNFLSITSTNKNARYETSLLEETIKKYLIPYNTFLKFSNTGEFRDIEPNQNFVLPEENYKWVGIEPECDYEENI